MSKQRYYLCLAGILGAWAVVMGAFGAHVTRLSDTAHAYDTAVRYHFYHTLAILAVTAAMGRILAGPWWTWACRAWTGGIVLFSGSLYALAVTGGEWLGFITPFGGAALIFGWVFVIVAAVRSAPGVPDE